MFREKLARALDRVNPQLEKIFGLPTYTVESDLRRRTFPWRSACAPTSARARCMLNDLIDEGKSILFEGAQATLLDIDHGTYPYVTSSNCTAGGAVTGSGVGMKHVDRVLGIMQGLHHARGDAAPCPRSSTTRRARAGSSPRAATSTASRPGAAAAAAGSTAPIANFAARVNGLTHIALTKLDVLSAFDTIPVCVAYDCDGVRYTSVPEHERAFAQRGARVRGAAGLEVRYLRRAAAFEELPKNAQDYVAAARGARAHAHRVRLGRAGPRADHQPLVALERASAPRAPR